MTDYASFQFGGASYPVASSGGSLLLRADPALYYAIDFFRSVITTYCDAAFVAAANDAGMTELTATGSVVRGSVPHDPGPDMQAVQTWGRLPILAVYRERAKYDERTVGRQERIDRWFLEYVLPPLSGAQLEIVGPILNAVDGVVLDRAIHGRDPFYSSDAAVFGSANCLTGISKIRVIERDRPMLTIRGESTNTHFRMTSMTLAVTETKVWTSEGLQPLGGIDTTIQVAPNDGSNPVDRVRFTNPAPNNNP